MIVGSTRPRRGRSLFSFYIPIAVVVFAILAERAIKKDDEMVRSADRLR
ncbi:MAG: DUF4293 family protein [Flavobacteriales bacterium]|nr:DUF4293 family protein [Flavobacteriales bacterium]MCC6937082.1 DUF4293 family protein [Flavobacteriales bacterium]